MFVFRTDLMVTCFVCNRSPRAESGICGVRERQSVFPSTHLPLIHNIRIPAGFRFKISFKFHRRHSGMFPGGSFLKLVYYNYSTPVFHTLQLKNERVASDHNSFLLHRFELQLVTVAL